ncbi:hypothetical protein I2485_10980 [Nesterenkonia sp. E16_7]|uniref:hypothetical protein n=1 Tax=unclassified Nesterenkonia TaxID=2629769 RepID=UPI001A930C37|nr:MULTISPECIES: hypothetical protein [unclassified Nesterenkonia]MBO0595387.1 hypothetical protein [Nesterenkonia sp. E16_10]MBO0599165.1 hypothetical protein [Nesterenkonia sp. E16_7]
MVFPAKYPSLNATEMTEEARQTLIRVLRVAFPHERVPDGPYERTADTILTEAQNETWFRVALTQGLLSLNQLADGDFRSLDDAAALRVLRRVEGTEFFGFVRRTAVLNLYDDAEVWTELGYEGASYDKGGYLSRGFNDLDWLPDPRVEFPEGETMPEMAPGAARNPRPAVTGPQSDSTNQPGSTSSDMEEVKK